MAAISSTIPSFIMVRQPIDEGLLLYLIRMEFLFPKLTKWVRAKFHFLFWGELMTTKMDLTNHLISRNSFPKWTKGFSLFAELWISFSVAGDVIGQGRLSIAQAIVLRLLMSASGGGHSDRFICKYYLLYYTR